MNTLVLERFGYMPFGTYGKLLLDGNPLCYTVERPWLKNQACVSCIPEGMYNLGLRHSKVIERTTKNVFHQGWEIMNVPNRTYIMIHPGNWPNDVKGCIAVGTEVVSMQQKNKTWVPAVTQSRDTFKVLMKILDVHHKWQLKVTHFHP